jgi:hypothetical protein
MRQLYARASRLRFFLTVAAISVITLAASSPIYSATSGGHLIGHTSEAPVAAAGGTAAQADCSKAAATETVLRLHLNDPEVADPVGKVLCGSFTGPGSQTMVVSLWGPGNTGLIAFAVFRWAGGAWQFLMKQPAAASITAAGSDIRQTLPIYRPGDPRCCPTGGKKSRIWRWNGKRFVASPWKRVTPKTSSVPAAKTGYFKTPSGNIVCLYLAGKGADTPLVVCGIKSGLRPAPPYTASCKAAGLDYNADRVVLSATGPARPVACSGDAGPFVGQDQARVLGYGKTWRGGGIRCASAVAGLTCRNKSGHGFFLSRAHWRQF